MAVIQLQSPDAYTEILPRIGYKFNHKLGDFYSKVEYEMVRSRKRKANVFHLSSHNYDNEIEKIIDDGMIFKPILRSRIYGGFSHKHIPVNTLGPDVMVYGVVSHDLETANTFKAAHLEHSTNHAIIGELLGYPECCYKAFEVNFQKSFDPVYESAESTPGASITHANIELNDYDPCLRVDLRYAGIRVIPFFPCSYNCKAASDVSKIWIDVMYSIDSDMTNEIISELEISPTAWSNLNGQIHVIHQNFQIMAGGYHDSAYREVRFL